MDLLYFRQQHSLASGHGAHTPPSLSSGDFPSSVGRCFLLQWWRKSLASRPEQHSQTAGEFQLPGALEQWTDSVEVQFA